MLPVCTCAAIGVARPTPITSATSPRNFLIRSLLSECESGRGVIGPVPQPLDKVCDASRSSTLANAPQAGGMISRKSGGFQDRYGKLDYLRPVYFVVMKRFIIIASLLGCATIFLVVRAATQAPAAKSPLTIENLIDIRHPSNPMWSPDGRRVVFVWDRAGVSNIYVSDLSGAPRELSGAGASLAGAFWSKDGRSLMVAKDGDLWRVPIDGSAAAAVWTTPQQELSITPSPDGS